MSEVECLNSQTHLPARDPHRHQGIPMPWPVSNLCEASSNHVGCKGYLPDFRNGDRQTWCRKIYRISNNQIESLGVGVGKKWNSHPAAKSLPNDEYTIIVYYNTYIYIYLNIMYISRIWIYDMGYMFLPGSLFLFFGDSSNLWISITKVLLLRGPLLDSCLSQAKHAIEPTSRSFESWRPQGHIQDFKLECWSEFSNPFFGNWIKVLYKLFKTCWEWISWKRCWWFYSVVLLHTLINKIKI